MDVLVIDVGGTHVKVLATRRRTPLEIRSGPKMTASEMVRQVKQGTAGWRYSVVAIGYPGPVLHGKPLSEPVNLGGGWVGFDFAKAFGHPVRVINDAAMQALGSYKGGRMLFLGLGTGLGSALIVDGELEPMELAHLPYKTGQTYEDRVGKAALNRLGKKKWRRNVAAVLTRLQAALEPDDVVVGGGNAKFLRTLPKGVRLGSNANAFAGGYRLWRATPKRTQSPGALSRSAARPRGRPGTSRSARAARPVRHARSRSGAAAGRTRPHRTG
jgi:polyphosphate glucokinase